MLYDGVLFAAAYLGTNPSGAIPRGAGLPPIGLVKRFCASCRLALGEEPNELRRLDDGEEKLFWGKCVGGWLGV